MDELTDLEKSVQEVVKKPQKWPYLRRSEIRITFFCPSWYQTVTHEFCERCHKRGCYLETPPSWVKGIFRKDRRY